MRFTTCFGVFLALVETTSLAKMMIEVNQSEEFADLEQSTITILTTCYANRVKTIVLVGDFPGTFIKKLSSHRTFSLILLDKRRRAEDHFEHWTIHDNDENWNIRYRKRTHKVDLVVTVASSYQRVRHSLQTFYYSPFNNPEASVLIIGFSPANKYAGCYDPFKVFEFLRFRDLTNLINANLICSYRKNNGIFIYGINPFANHTLEPWRYIGYSKVESERRYRFHYFGREYREDAEMCRNLDFDKTQDVGGLVIRTVHSCNEGNFEDDGFREAYVPDRLVKHEEESRLTYIYNFIPYVNATQQHTCIQRSGIKNAIVLRPIFMRGVHGFDTYALPIDTDCKFLLTQFRGNKTQLQKIFSVIDIYSWIGTLVAYFITLMFFKYFLRQSLIGAFLNLVRLSSNFGITREPTNIASRIYLGCLLFSVVTMQGIFTGNLASLLTHDVPVRQVDSIQNLIDMGYTIHVGQTDIIYFENLYFNSNLLITIENTDRFRIIVAEPLHAGLCWGATVREAAARYNLHVSDCIVREYISNLLPWRWILQERLTKFMGIVIANGITVNLDTIVGKERFADINALEIPDEPKIMTFTDLRFAFVFLSVALGISFTTFIIEILIERYHRRSTTARVIVL